MSEIKGDVKITIITENTPLLAKEFKPSNCDKLTDWFLSSPIQNLFHHGAVACGMGIGAFSIMIGVTIFIFLSFMAFIGPFWLLARF